MGWYGSVGRVASLRYSEKGAREGRSLRHMGRGSRIAGMPRVGLGFRCYGSCESRSKDKNGAKSVTIFHEPCGAWDEPLPHPLPASAPRHPPFRPRRSAIRATVACAPLWYFDFQWDRCTLKRAMRPASLEIESVLVPKFWADPEVRGTQRSRTAVGRTDARLDARWARRWLPRGAERRGEILSL